MGNAIGMVEFTSIAKGIFTVDQMVKVAEVEVVAAVSTCPGKYFVIITGDVASVENSVQVGEEHAKEYLVDFIMIPNVSQDIFPAISGATMPEHMGAIGIVESFSISTMVIAADAILKSVDVEAIELRLGNGLGGKAFFTFTGDVAAVSAGVDQAKKVMKSKGLLVNAEVIPSPSTKLIPALL
ncbi:BMC domain-containing protein [Halodesulfovibrio sp.]|jgi:microcompartment protein CcmL/EutN|uniref:BMC domain-containing protein n=1 Tax=Halodesulfovibrio sp. TaxID=1912772 RepID=UPI0025F5507D|nr:BMC domain-containing protein [Halodesulfovibrio sp.]MCT4535114.1 BMC domain-containing protein [Halodesulfovibrio sp.]MCT4627412.1 BMC domain-containing protein [Halodesulfovibrio sp.]